MKAPTYNVHHVIFDGKYIIFAGRKAPKWLLKKTDASFDDHEVDELASKYGTEFMDVLQLKKLKGPVTFTDHIIFDDDTIEAVRCKIANVVNVNSDDIYLWCEYETNWNFLALFTQIARGRALVSGIEIENALTSILSLSKKEHDMLHSLLEKKVFTLQEALNVVDELGLTSKKGCCALGVSFRKGGTDAYIPADPQRMIHVDMSIVDTVYEHGRLMESYGKIKKLFATGKLDSTLRHHILGSNGLKRCSNIMNASKTHAKATSKTKNSYVSKIAVQSMHMRVHCPSKVNLRELFKYFQPGPLFPFARYASIEGVLFKLNKIALTSTEQGLPVYLEKSWTRKDRSLAAASSRSSENLNIMVYIGKPGHIPYYATLTFHTMGYYDVKMSFSVNDVISKEFVVQCVDKVNDVVSFINAIMQSDENDAIPHVDPLVITSSEDRPTTKLLRCSATITFTPTSEVKPSPLHKVRAIIESDYNSCFYIVPYIESSENVLNLGYRRVSNFDSVENMSIFIKKSQSRTNKERMAKYLMTMFGVDADDALKVVLDYVGSRPTSTFNSLRVTISLDKMRGAVKANLMDVTSFTYIERIAKFISFILTTAAKTDIDTNNGVYKPVKEDIDPTLDMILRGLNFAGDVDIEGDIETDLPIDDDNDDNDNIEVEFEAFKEENNDDTTEYFGLPTNTYVFEGDVPPPTQTEPPPKKKKDRKESLMLNELYKADGDLFNPPKKGAVEEDDKRNYSTRCQMTVADMPRQPVVIKPSELVEIRKNNPGAIRNWIAYGSNDIKAKQNIYICPEVWCPLSRVAMTGEQYEKNGSVCPKGEDAVKYYKSNYFSSSHMYVKLQDHPDTTSFNKCAPCCFKTFPGRDRKTGKLKEGYVFHDDKCPVEGMLNDDAPVKETSRGDKERYIMKEDVVPLGPGRYGLLNPALANILGNKGAKTTGHITKETNAFVRTGIPYKKQGFFECMARVLNNDKLKSSEDVIRIILTHLTVDDFMTIQDGLLIKKFMIPDDNIIERVAFREFYTWFFHAERAPYIDKFGLEYVRDAMWMTKGIFKPSMPYADHVRREYVIYRAFQRFLDFIRDDNHVKTHDSSIHLFLCHRLKWLNPSQTNIIIFEMVNNEVRFYCYPHRDAEDIIKLGRPFVMLLKNGMIYEPIYRVKVEGVTVVSKYRFDAYEDGDIARLVSYMIKTCKRDKTKSVSNSDAHQYLLDMKKAGVSIKGQVIDYDFHVVAIIDEKDVLIPLPRTCPIFNNINGKTMFIDTFYVNVNPTGNVLKHAEKLFNNLGFVYERKGNKALLVSVNGFKTPFFVPIMKLTSNDIPHIADIDIFVRTKSADPRKDAVDMTYAIDRLHIASRNEIIHRIKLNKALLMELDFLRHPANPIPKDIKRKMLIDLIQPDLDVVLHKSSTHRNQDDVHTDMSLCSTRPNPACVGPCQLLITVQKKTGDKSQRCALSIPTSIYDVIIARLIDDLINPYLKLKTMKVNAHSPNVDVNVVTFTASDIEAGRLTRIISHALDDDAMRLGIEKYTEEMDIESFKATECFKDPVKITGKEKNVHALFRSKLRDFSAIVIDDYTPLTMYTLFCSVGKRIGTSTMKPEALRDVVARMTVSEFLADKDKTLERLKDNRIFTNHFKKKLDELSHDDVLAWYMRKDAFPGKADVVKMADIVGIELLLISRVSASNPDVLRCMTKNGSGFYIILQQMSHGKTKGREYDRFDVVVTRDTKKIILESTDFKDLEFRDTILKKCKRVIVKRSS